MSEFIGSVSVKNKNDERELDRRGFLQCMAWVGTGAIWTMTGGILKGMPIEHGAGSGAVAGGLRFVQISDSHIGFNKDANPDVTATLRAAIAKIHAMPQAPSLVLHTGDLTHLSKPEEFDTLQQELSGIGAPVFYVPGEHDVLNDNGKSYLESAVASTGADGSQVVVDNFSFSPAAATVPAGVTVTWTNRDDVPHNIVSTEKKFKSPVLDTDQQFSYRFEAPGTYPYFCSLHPKMTGRIVVA
jgi:plastocyanin